MLWEERVGAVKKDSTYNVIQLIVRSYNNSKYVSVAVIVQVDDLGAVEETIAEEKISSKIYCILQYEDYVSCIDGYAIN